MLKLAIEDKELGLLTFAYNEIIGFVEREKEKSYVQGRKEALEEIKGKFADGVLIGIGGDKIVAVSNPQFGIWLKKELDKLSGKDNG